ncbi:MAG: ferrochelatase, partial [Chlamydiae bacterium]|nr:ferrochelatase [Chlamydiota bacterium]
MSDLTEKDYACLLVNFGGPRNLEEIESFLQELLCDQDVIRTNLPPLIHKIIFSRVAKKRALKIREDYEQIGSKSPIFEDTEAIAAMLQESLHIEVIPFHRYLKGTHSHFFSKVNSLSQKELRILPLFPQFSYATTGSIARFFLSRFCGKILQKMLWIKSYPSQTNYIDSMQRVLRDFLLEKGLSEEETILLFSAHGIPQKFVCTGDIYQKECELSFEKIRKFFPKAQHLLSYQSKFGKGLWLTPSTEDMCKTLVPNTKKRKNVVLVPLSFTSDHIETLFEIEKLYLPLLQERNFLAFRCPALNRETHWIDAMGKILSDPSLFATTQMLIRHKEYKLGCKNCCKNSCLCKG